MLHIAGCFVQYKLLLLLQVFMGTYLSVQYISFTAVWHFQGDTKQ